MRPRCRNGRALRPSPSNGLETSLTGAGQQQPWFNGRVKGPRKLSLCGFWTVFPSSLTSSSLRPTFPGKLGDCEGGRLEVGARG